MLITFEKCARKMADPILEMANENQEDTFNLKIKCVKQNFQVPHTMQ